MRCFSFILSIYSQTFLRYFFGRKFGQFCGSIRWRGHRGGRWSRLTHGIPLVITTGSKIEMSLISGHGFVFSCVRLDKFSLTTMFTTFSWMDKFSLPAVHSNFPCSKASMTSLWTSLLVKGKLVNLCCMHEQIKVVKGKLVKENLVVYSGL